MLQKRRAKTKTLGRRLPRFLDVNKFNINIYMYIKMKCGNMITSWPASPKLRDSKSWFLFTHAQIFIIH